MGKDETHDAKFLSWRRHSTLGPWRLRYIVYGEDLAGKQIRIVIQVRSLMDSAKDVLIWALPRLMGVIVCHWMIPRL